MNDFPLEFMFEKLEFFSFLFHFYTNDPDFFFIDILWILTNILLSEKDSIN